MNSKVEVYACRRSCRAFQKRMSTLSTQELESLNEDNDPTGYELIQNAFSAFNNNSTEMFEHTVSAMMEQFCMEKKMTTNLQRK